MFAVQIHPIPEGQQVAVWAQSFKAATATLKDEQRRSLLPAYVRRVPGEVLLAVEAAKEASLDEALKKLEELVDGKADPVESMRTFLGSSPNQGPLTGYLKTLCDLAEKAGIGIQPAWLKFCTEVDGGNKLHKKSKGKLSSTTTFKDMAGWVTEWNTPLKATIKEEAFAVNHDMAERMANMEMQMKNLTTTGFTDTRESSEEECSMVCYGCGLEGHMKRDCKVKCRKCKKRGHLAKDCKSTGTKPGKL